ncbi:uncharacterized protein LOC141817682 isoform X1 [Curcuma longa]|uniref:uncharacterized protein LOC141817682 isoform X1 n=1 Tax=Curcuma longa TaxID=136217 RepID=UPI003D9EF335
MDSNLTKANQVEDEEEYILLDLDDVCVDADIPANTPFVLSGLDTMNPVLAIGDHLKLIGEYQETMGTCYIFTESGETPSTTCADTTTSEANSSEDKKTTDAKQNLAHQVKPIASLQKILKFKLVTEDPNGVVEGMTTSMS